VTHLFSKGGHCASSVPVQPQRPPGPALPAPPVARPCLRGVGFSGSLGTSAALFCPCSAGNRVPESFTTSVERDKRDSYIPPVWAQQAVSMPRHQPNCGVH
jgi:hypothetical protein